MLRKVITIALVGAAMAPAGAFAQSAPNDTLPRYVPAPWWMRDPVVAAIGRVYIDLPANRASFNVVYRMVGSSVEQAMVDVVRRSGPLDAQLRAFGEDKLRFRRTVLSRPLYRQYRNEDGDMVDNERADQIERYEVTSTISVEIRDVSVVEQVYAAVTASSPSAVDEIDWSLLPDNATITALATAATRDAVGRAREAAAAAGARLGSVRIIDPSSSVCSTGVLTGWPGHMAGDEERDVSNDIVVTGSLRSAPVPVPATSSGAGQVTLRPPIMRRSDTSCVIFSILP